jgi:hypothetical protein
LLSLYILKINELAVRIIKYLNMILCIQYVVRQSRT